MRKLLLFSTVNSNYYATGGRLLPTTSQLDRAAMMIYSTSMYKFYSFLVSFSLIQLLITTLSFSLSSSFCPVTPYNKVSSSYVHLLCSL